jgi:hypothetical protein
MSLKKQNLSAHVQTQVVINVMWPLTIASNGPSLLPVETAPINHPASTPLPSKLHRRRAALPPTSASIVAAPLRLQSLLLLVSSLSFLWSFFIPLPHSRSTPPNLVLSAIGLLRRRRERVGGSKSRRGEPVVPKPVSIVSFFPVGFHPNSSSSSVGRRHIWSYGRGRWLLCRQEGGRGCCLRNPEWLPGSDLLFGAYSDTHPYSFTI